MSISIVIPCYNSGIFLLDAIQSLVSCSQKLLFDVIIVNDGSTDLKTLSILSELESKGYKIVHQNNKGPAAARNTGVRVSKGKYLFFLDSDNKVRDTYIKKGIEILEKDNEVGIVYAKPNFFGDSTKPRFFTTNFNIYKLLEENYIDMCSVVRREVWENIGGFDEDRRIVGHEDWDFWIKAAKADWKFHFINEQLFDYRITKGSLIEKAVEDGKNIQVLGYIYSKHCEFVNQKFRDLHQQYIYYKNDKKAPLRSFVKFLYKKYISQH